MAKNRKYAEGEVPEPTFDKQMEAYSEEDTNADDPIFSSAYHKFMANLLKTRDAAVKDELTEEIGKLFIENNKTILGSIGDLLTEQTASVGRVVGEVMVAIEGLDKKLSQVELANRNEHANIMTELTDLKTRQDTTDEKIRKEELELKYLKKQIEEHKERFELKKKRIDSLERSVAKREKDILEKIKSIDDEIHGEMPITIFCTYKLEKWIMFFILAVLVSTLITFFSIRSHSKQIKAAGQNGNIQIENIK
jgi:hypothetical protein